MEPRFPSRSSLPWLAFCGLWLLLLGVGLTGCGDSGPVGEGSDRNLQMIATMYNQYRMQHNGRPPESEQELQQFIADRAQEILDRAGLEMSELFTSENDGQPFVVLYGREGDRGNGPVVYEQTGVGDMRYVGYRGGSTEKVDEAKFQQITARPGK